MQHTWERQYRHIKLRPGNLKGTEHLVSVEKDLDTNTAVKVNAGGK